MNAVIRKKKSFCRRSEEIHGKVVGTKQRRPHARLDFEVSFTKTYMKPDSRQEEAGKGRTYKKAFKKTRHVPARVTSGEEQRSF